MRIAFYAPMKPPNHPVPSGDRTMARLMMAALELAGHEVETDHAPICAVGPHSGDPHYEPRPGPDGIIKAGDFVLIDLWAKLDRPRAVYSDLTWTGYVGKDVPARYAPQQQKAAE